MNHSLAVVLTGVWLVSSVPGKDTMAFAVGHNGVPTSSSSNQGPKCYPLLSLYLARHIEHTVEILDNARTENLAV